MNPNEFPKTGQRLTFSIPHTDSISNQENPAIPASADDIAKDELGFTNPNLHRRIRINELQDGEKIYTIAEPFTTKTSETGILPTYETKYPIAKINFVYISGSSWNGSTEIVGDNAFRFSDGDAPAPDLPMEVIYETTPLIDDEVAYREYELAISGVYSYRTTKMFLHTEEDEGNRYQRVYENEIP